MANYDYSEVIKEAYKGIEKLFKNSKAWEQEDGKIV
jgi:hypothetical protein